MVRCKSILATLALVATTQAGPIALPQDIANGSSSSNAVAKPAIFFPFPKDERNCRLKPFEPKSWAASGAEKFLGDWLDKNGSGNAIVIFRDLELTFYSQ